jgi:hypothetical protein
MSHCIHEFGNLVFLSSSKVWLLLDSVNSFSWIIEYCYLSFVFRQIKTIGAQMKLASLGNFDSFKLWLCIAASRSKTKKQWRRLITHIVSCPQTLQSWGNSWWATHKWTQTNWFLFSILYLTSLNIIGRYLHKYWAFLITYDFSWPEKSLEMTILEGNGYFRSDKKTNNHHPTLTKKENCWENPIPTQN